jgi:hypothetical protein
MPPLDVAGVEPEDEPLGGGAGDQQEDTERAGSPTPAAAGGDQRGDAKAPEIGDDEDLAVRLEVDPGRGDVKG